MKAFGLVILLFILTFGLGACNSGGSTTKTYSATLSGANEVPAVSTTATGSVTATLNGKVLTVTGSFTGLSAPSSGAHIHGPASKTESNGVISPLTYTEDATSGTISGTLTLSDAQIAELQDGKYYVNVHSTGHASGEIRGQLE